MRRVTLKEKIMNATIEECNLSIDEGFLTLWLTLKLEDGFSKAFGGYNLGKTCSFFTDEVKLFNKQDFLSDNKDNCNLANWFINSCMYTVGVHNLKDFKGKNIRIKVENPGFGRTIVGIGHIIEDKWFFPKEDRELLQ